VPEVLKKTYPRSMFAKAVAKRTAGGKPAGIPAPALARMTDMALRFREMDAMGIDIQVISPSILQQCTYWAKPEAALKLERISNDRIADAVAAHPDRLVGIGSVPLQDVRLAVRELQRAVGKLGLKGVIIGSNVNGTELGDKRFRPFWRKAEALGAAIFIHPAGSTDPRMRPHSQLITVGQPLEEALAQGSLVYDGVMDAFPKLKVAIAHGGGYLPFYTGRHDHIQKMGMAGTGLKGNFSSYLKRFNYETVLFNPDMLEYLATRVPVKNIMMGTDYPFGERNPVKFVRSARRISKSAQDAILGANAAKFLGISI
jgi:aminocarboxymuconate-semialdehyde decarboxylase